MFNNNFSNINNGAGIGGFYGSYWYYGGQTSNIYNNVFSNITYSASTAISYLMYGPYYSLNTSVYNNTFSNITWGTAGTIYGYYCFNYYAATANIYNNVFSNWTGAAATIYPIYYYISGGFTAGSISKLYGNKVTNISTTNAAGIIYGIYENNPYANANHSIYNNLIGNLSASASTNANAVCGIYINPTTTSPINVSYNTIYL